MLPGREVAKGVKMRRVRTVIVAPNIEQIETEGGLDDLLANILQQAEAAGIPVVFALSRKKLGQVHPSCRPCLLVGVSCPPEPAHPTHSIVHSGCSPQNCVLA